MTTIRLLIGIFGTLLRIALSALADLLSPSACAACGGDPPRHAVFCPSCASTVVRSGLGPDGILAFAEFGGATAMALWRFKYESRPDLAGPLGDLMRRTAREAGVVADVVVPVPLHPKRLAERGYNQAALLARAVAREIGAAFAPMALRRVRATAQQARLGRQERQENMDGAFATRAPRLVAGRHVLLVDDVATTGATLGECKRALLGAGAASVQVIVFARAGKGAANATSGVAAPPGAAEGRSSERSPDV
jgi:ComF family protein